MKALRPDWKSDWHEFVWRVYGDFSSGKDNAFVSQKYGNTEVIWYGTVHHANFPEDERSVLTLKMPLVWIPQPSQKPFLATHLAFTLSVVPDNASSSISAGDFIQFKVVLSQGMAVFPGISWRSHDTFDTVSVTCDYSEVLEVFSIPKH